VSTTKRKPPNPRRHKQQPQKIRKTNRVFSAAFKIQAAERMLAGQPVRKLSEELRIKRTVLYRWREAYQQYGKAGLCRPTGRPVKTPLQRQAEIDASKELKIAALERTVGQQQMEIRFLQQASKRLEESRHKSTSSGGTASTEPSGK
jgi:transposase